MAARFFITGLPRSRTAWCANLFSTGDAFCWHDGLANCASLDEFDTKLNTAPICGDSDSGLVFFYDALRDRYPDAQWAVIRRDPEEVVRSLVAMPRYAGLPEIEEGDARTIVREADAILDRIAKDARVLSVPWDSLSNGGARALWWHCLRDAVPWNEARFQQLRNLNVTVRSGDVMLSLEASYRLFGRAA